MVNNDEPVCCVSVHDVSAHTWNDCERLIASIPLLATLPLTLLLVPDWHGRGARDAFCSRKFDQAISRLRDQGHELCLHGYAHLDGPEDAADFQAAVSGQQEPWQHRIQRRIITRSEGEFAALGREEAARRLQRGLAWLSARGWSARGFVPPAWMISEQGIDAVRDAGFDYLGLYRAWVRLADGKRFAAPTITYTTRCAAGDALWRVAQEVLAVRERHCPVVRLALHPADLRRPANVRHAGRLLERWLASRSPLTEVQAFARIAGCSVRKE